MADKPWKREERKAAALIAGARYPANLGRRVDAEGPELIAQVKHVQRLSLAQLEALAGELAQLGTERSKVAVVMVKRRAGRGSVTARLVVMTQEVFNVLWTIPDTASAD